MGAAVLKHIPEPNAGAPFQFSLGVIGAPPTWLDSDSEPVVFEAYVREMQVWADLFATVEVCSPAGEGPRRGNLCRYDRPNIVWTPCVYSETFDGLLHRLRRLLQMPRACLQIAATILRNDVVLLRSPTHFGLVGAVFVSLVRRPSITRWAGYNGPTPGERLPSLLNRWVESVVRGNHATLVYGPPKGRHQESFIPALMSRREIAEARRLSLSTRAWEEPWRLLCVGRLAYDKNFELVIRALGIVRRTRPDLRWSFTLVGDGLMRDALEKLARLELNGEVTFPGALPFRKVQEFYAASHMAVTPRRGRMEPYLSRLPQVSCLPFLKMPLRA
jgi:glycosyltransferase involved in cell wall biosynthesis